MADGLRKNDPNREILDSEKSDRTPGFLGGNGGGDAPGGLYKGASQKAKKANNAKNVFGGAEADAADQGEDPQEEGGFYRGEGGVIGAKKNEESGGGLYKASVAQSGGKKKGKGKFLGKLSGSKKGLLFGLILSVFGIGAGMSLTQLGQPMSMVANFLGRDNSMQRSAFLRSNSLFRKQMNPKGRNLPDGINVKNPIKGKIFSEDTFKITSKQAKKLALHGIEYDDEFKYSGGTARVLKYTDGDGSVKIVTADPATAKNIGGDAIDFETFYKQSDDFSSKYNSGSMTWRGAIANWFGSLTKKFLSSNKLTRNMFEDYKEKTNDADPDAKGEVAKKIIAEHSDEVEGGKYRRLDAEGETDQDGNTVTDENGDPVTKYDEDGNPIPKSTDEDIEGFKRGDITDPSAAKSKFSGVADKVVGNASKVVNIGCTVMNVVGAISLLVAASEALQIINLTTAYFETVDKTKAGLGEDAPIHELSNALNEKVENKNDVLKSTGKSWNDSNEESNLTYSSSGEVSGVDTLTTETVTTKKSAIQSSGMAALFGGGKVNPKDPSVQSFNMTSSLKTLMGGLGTSMAMFKTCALSKLAVSLAGAVKDGIEVAACIAGVIGAVFTLGGSVGVGCGPLIADTIRGIAVSVAVGLVVSAVVATITPMAAKALTRDLVSNLGGEDLGNALVSGSLMYQGSSHRANGGSLSNRNKYIAYAAEEEKVLAENARYERLTLSPFDISSNNTFMGAIFAKMMGFMSSSTLMDVVTTSSSTVSSSLLGMIPSASAYDINETLPTEEEYENTCPYLASIGAVGDAYCNPYVITDVSTIEMDPLDVINKIEGNFSGETADGNVIIDEGSDLAKYIQFCDQRQSPFGIADTNIVNAVSSWGQTGSTAVDSAIGAIPVVGDAIDVVGNSISVSNVGYVGGESCVAGNKIDQENSAFSASPGWDTAEYYQRFIEDQAWAETTGLIDESAVSVYLDKYYEKNPLDNSYEGILARKSGLDKETVVAVLDLIDYGEYIANYDPSERYAFGAPVVEEDNTLLFDNDNTVAADAVLLNAISFADVRNRSYAV